MRIMIDTNVLVSIFFPFTKMSRLVDVIMERHTIVLPSYVLDELKTVIKRKFSEKFDLLDRFIQELPFSLINWFRWEVLLRVDFSFFPNYNDCER
jgi:predicted nucleic acid-binding protein